MLLAIAKRNSLIRQIYFQIFYVIKEKYFALSYNKKNGYEYFMRK